MTNSRISSAVCGRRDGRSLNAWMTGRRGCPSAEFQYKGRTFVRILSPARVQDLDGVTREYYASANEELVEDALRKIATEQQSGYFDKPNYRSGVVFTLYALREELKKRGHTRSYQQIVLALNI